MSVLCFQFMDLVFMTAIDRLLSKCHNLIVNNWWLETSQYLRHLRAKIHKNLIRLDIARHILKTRTNFIIIVFIYKYLRLWVIQFETSSWAQLYEVGRKKHKPWYIMSKLRKYNKWHTQREAHKASSSTPMPKRQPRMLRRSGKQRTPGPKQTIKPKNTTTNL